MKDCSLLLTRARCVVYWTNDKFIWRCIEVVSSQEADSCHYYRVSFFFIRLFSSLHTDTNRFFFFSFTWLLTWLFSAIIQIVSFIYVFLRRHHYYATRCFFSFSTRHIVVPTDGEGWKARKKKECCSDVCRFTCVDQTKN
jgi:hypothetical protein